MASRSRRVGPEQRNTGPRVPTRSHIDTSCNAMFREGTIGTATGQYTVAGAHLETSRTEGLTAGEAGRSNPHHKHTVACDVSTAHRRGRAAADHDECLWRSERPESGQPRQSPVADHPGDLRYERRAGILGIAHRRAARLDLFVQRERPGDDRERYATTPADVTVLPITRTTTRDVGNADLAHPNAPAHHGITASTRTATHDAHRSNASPPRS